MPTPTTPELLARVAVALGENHNELAQMREHLQNLTAPPTLFGRVRRLINHSLLIGTLMVGAWGLGADPLVAARLAAGLWVAMLLVLSSLWACVRWLHGTQLAKTEEVLKTLEGILDRPDLAPDAKSAP